jgi:poly(hydroxyalkanoate) granule-associated protein
MVKKMSSTTDKAAKGVAKGAAKGAAGLQGSQLAGAVKDSAQHIWLAGMGAFSKAQAEGGKVFEALVREGQNLQRKTQGLAEDRISEVTGRMSAMADTVTAKAGQNWDKLESIFEARTAKAMTKLGVPTAKDVDALVQRVDELAAAVARLSKATPAAKAPAKKVAAKKAVASKPLAAKARSARKTARTA